MLATVEIKLKLEANARKDGNDWIAWCPPLDLYAQAESLEAAMQSLREAVHAWVESCLERKVLREALEEAGFRLNNSGDVPNEVSIIQISPNMQSEPIHQELEISVPAYIAAGLYPTHAPC